MHKHKSLHISPTIGLRTIGLPPQPQYTTGFVWQIIRGNAMKTRPTLLALALGSSLLWGCAQTTSTTTPASATTVVSDAKQQASVQANKLFDELYMAGVMRSPITQTYMGIKQDQDKWDDISDQATLAEIEHIKTALTTISAIDPTTLDADTQISLMLLKQQYQNAIADAKWRFYSYPVNQMYGMHSMAPSLLINQHQISDEIDARAYIARLAGIEPLFKQLQVNLEERAQQGIIAPKFVFPYVISDSQNILQGAPFDGGADSTLFADFKRKVNQLNISDASKQALISDAQHALLQHVKPAYEQLVSYLKQLEKRADSRAGAWKFPDGKAFYNNALARTTTTDLTAEQIHDIGLKEVARIHEEMRGIMKEVGFKGDLQAFFQFMRTDKQFYYPEGPEGQAAYLQKATALIDTMKSRLDELFIAKPKADMFVKQVEAFREKSAGKAFYEQPAPDGSRPGIYYANLYKMADMPTYQMEALAYHEGIPGHHMQIAIAQELDNMPMFRRFGDYTAYIEGWGLYTELLPKEIGMYQDPYSDFGRLAMELWRACRLVVDTGLHAKMWTREQAIAWLQNNTPNSEGDVVKAIERYIVMPSQATAYKIGMLKILELRSKAQQQLGDQFDIRQFHDVVLKNGPLPLNVLEQMVDNWIASKKA